MLSKLLRISGHSTENTLINKYISEDNVPVIEDDQPMNPFNEIQILTGHQDIINILKIIDDIRLASSADDNLVIIWNVQTGDHLCCLKGHKRPVTSMLVHQKSRSSNVQEYVPVLITGSSDKTIRMWYCDDWVCFSTIQDHGSTVKCLVNIQQDFMFCSGGKDLCLWDSHGQLLFKKCQPNPDSDVQSILPIKKDKLVIACRQQSLDVYCVTDVSSKKALTFCAQLQPHREDVRCLVKMTDEKFASASLDGEIFLWSSNSLEPLGKFNTIHEYEGINHLYPYSIQHMLIINQRFIFAAIGSGFSVYDSDTGRCVARRKNAHHSKVSHIELLKERGMLVTCSEDGTVRLWGSSIGRLLGELSTMEQFLGKSLSNILESITEPKLLGECRGHSGSVRMIANFGDEGFASCAIDGLIILWKDGLRQRQKRMELVANLLHPSS